MGFRGEALASVAAVAEVELKTRPAGEELGTRLVIAGSKVESQEAVSCPKGSNFSVKNLFFNIPARRKFLKANSTELSNILAEFERIAWCIRMLLSICIVMMRSCSICLSCRCASAFSPYSVRS